MPKLRGKNPMNIQKKYSNKSELNIRKKINIRRAQPPSFMKSTLLPPILFTSIELDELFITLSKL